MNELRREPLLGRWVVVVGDSLGPEDYHLPEEAPAETGCVLCEEHGTERFKLDDQSGKWRIRVIEPEDSFFTLQEEMGRKGVGIYDRMNAVGLTEVVIESPEHDRAPEDYGDDHFSDLIEVFYQRLKTIEEDPRIRYVMIHKNCGLQSGDPFGHPHTYITATPVIPMRIKAELDGAKNYYGYKERCIFCDIMHEELRSKERIVMETERFLVFTPFAARFPFECWILPRRHRCSFKDTDPDERKDLGVVMRRLILAMRKVLRDPPYNYVIHTAPSRIPRMAQWHTLGEDYHWHIEVMPRIRKLTGFELGSGMYILTTSPEDAAKYIKEEVAYGD